MVKITVARPAAERDGDEMARIPWSFINEKPVLPSLAIELKYYDLDTESHGPLTSVRPDRP